MLWLRLKGYQILDRRLKTPVGELDLIARRGKVICFVEVKARNTRDAALDALGTRQRRRIERAAAWWCANRQHDPTISLRFDLIAVTPGRRPVHVMDAWRL